MNKKAVLEKFGTLLVNRVRDEAISSLDKSLEGRKPDIYSQFLWKLSQEESVESKEFLKLVTPHIVDATIALFLQLIDMEEEITLCFVDDEETTVNLGDLTDSLEAEYSYSEGWSRTLTRERLDSIRIQAKKAFDATYSTSLRDRE